MTRLGTVVAYGFGALLMTTSCRAADPSWLRVGPHAAYDGVSDDLVTGGLGAGAMVQPPPGYPDPLHPTAAQLRQHALFLRSSPGQGFNRLFGPGIDHTTGKSVGDDGKIAGDETLAYADGGDGRQNVAMLLQVPRQLGDRRCLLAVPVNGSSSLFRDVADFGYWGLRHGCAVVYTDKGHGNGFDIIEAGTVNTIDGRQLPLTEVGRDAHFRADLDATARAEFLAAAPHRIAFKAAHSKQNPEKDWGENVRTAIRFALIEMSRRDPGWTRANTLVIATGSSNGGGAALYAAEKDAADTERLIDGTVVREPQEQSQPDDRVVVEHDGRELRGSGRTLLDYFSFGNLYQPCAVLAVPAIPLRERVEFAANRCASLHEKGLLAAADTGAQATEALARMRAYGWDADTDVGHAFGYFVAPDATASKYANDHGRFDVRDRLCGYSYGAVDKDGRPVAVPPSELAQNFAIAPGGAPAGSIDVINDNDPTGPRRSWVSVSRSTGRQDYNLDGALCIRELVTGHSPEAERVRSGIQEFLATGRLGGRPVLIVHGRSDDRVPVTFSSRPYVGLNSLRDGESSRLRYIEVTNAEHFGTDLPGFDSRMVPLTLYHLRALDLMWEHLTTGSDLPGSQVVHTVPRGGEPGHAPDLTAANVPPIALHPAPENRITVTGGRVTIPE